VVYVDDAILILLYKTLIHKEIKSLQEEYDLMDDSKFQDYLGIHLEQSKDGSLKLLQPQMIKRVPKIVGLDNNGRLNSTIYQHPSTKYWTMTQTGKDVCKNGTIGPPWDVSHISNQWSDPI
jgi:hypothetical protein